MEQGAVTRELLKIRVSAATQTGTGDRATNRALQQSCAMNRAVQQSRATEPCSPGAVLSSSWEEAFPFAAQAHLCRTGSCFGRGN